MSANSSGSVKTAISKLELTPDLLQPKRSSSSERELVFVLEKGLSAQRSKRQPSRVPRNLVACGSLALLGLVVFLQYMEWHCVDEWPAATLLAFGPKWIFLFLPAILFPLSCRWHPYSLVVLGAASLLILGPLMGFSLGRGSELWQTSETGSEFRLVTCNVQEKPNPGRLWNALEQSRPDFVTLQEWPLDTAPPFASEDGWHLARSGHLLIASRFPILTTTAINSPLEPWRQIALRAEVQTLSGTINVISVHLMTPRPGFDAVLSEGWRGESELRTVIDKRRQESLYVREQIKSFAAPTLIAGDFNMPVNSQIYRTCWKDYTNAFSSTGIGWGFTKYTCWHGVRIDQVLADGQWDFRQCRVGGPLGSDHRPVIADVVYLPPLDAQEHKNQRIEP